MFELTPYSTRRSVYDPFNFFSDFFGTNNAPTELRTDISDRGDSFVLQADLPGFKKEDISLNLDGDTLTIQAQRHSEHEDQETKGKYVCCERSYGAYSRSFDVSGIRTEGITASYDSGVLDLKLPKKTVEVSSSRQINIE